MLKTLTVSELSNYISAIFEAEELLQNIKVYGEVSGVSYVRGNLYFTLKDEGAMIPCIMFGVNPGVIKEGDQILATGGMKYYGKGGKLNFYVVSAVPYGSGILYKKFLELKYKLEKEGLFNIKSKNEMPKNIKSIGVITSATGAVLHDIQTVSHRRNPCLNIYVYPAKVQGVGAEQTIIKGLEYFDKSDKVDVIIIARGGGSIEDLQPFNTESLARKIAEIKKPVVSAVGHETDFTICDFVSSIRAATPSEGAELVSNNIYEGLEKINNNLSKLQYLTYHFIDSKQESLDTKISKLNLTIEQQLKDVKYKYNQKILTFYNLKDKLFVKNENNLEIYKNKLALLNPKDVLNRGWVRLSKNNKLITSIKNIKEKDSVLIELKDGAINATVDNIITEGSKNEF